MSEASIMSPVGQEIEEPLNSSILFNSDSTCSSLELSQNSIATEGNCSDASMDFQIDRFSVSDTEADSAIILLKSLNSESPSSSFVSRRNDNSAILRLNNELLKAKRSNWEVVDALGKAYEDIRNLRLREQRLNVILSTCNGKHVDTNGFPESLSSPDCKIIELQLALRREEAFKTREDLRTMIEERDKLKEKLGKSESDRRLVSLTSDQRARELEISQNYINDLTANIKEKDAKIFSAQDKLISLELQIKTKDEEMQKISEEKNNLRDAVIRSEQEIEFLTEKLRKLSLPKQEHAKCLNKGRDHTQESQSFDQSDGKVSYVEENMGNFFRDETRLEKGMQYLESRHNQDMKIIQELSSKLKEWERFVKSMNDHALDSNQQQLQARTKIADYIKMLEQQLHELKNNRPISIDDYRYSSKAVKQNDRGGYTDQDLREDDQVSPQMVQQTQAENANFERYLKSSQSDFDEQGVLRDVSDHDPFDSTNDMDEEDDFELASRFRSSARHLVQPDDVRMARLTTIDGFVCPHSPPGMDNAADKNTPKRPPRKTDSRKRRKLPNVTRKLSGESGHSTDSLVTRSDETASVTSFESHMSRDNARFRRGSGGGSNRRLPPVPSGEEINLSKQKIVEDRPATEPPSVMSIYKVKEGPRSVNNQSQDSGLGKSEKNDPSSPSHASHKFSFSSFRRKFSKGKESSGTHVDVDSLRKPKKGLFKQKLSLLRRRKRRRNSIGSVSSASESFRTITPLNSDKEDVANIGNEPFDWGRSQSPRTISTSYKKGGVSRKSRNVSDRHRRACLWLVFQHLNPIELCGLARVCREWREISEHPSLWKQVTLEDIPVNNMALQAVSRRCSCMQYLKLKGLKITKSRDKNHDSKPDDLSCYLERGLEFLLKTAGSSMQSLHIEDCGIFLTDRCLSLVGCYCRELKEMVYVSDTFPVCPEALWALWACRQLHTLRVPPMFPSYHPGRFNDKSLEMISNCWPNLRQLTVGGPSITSAGLIHIAKGCLRLQELELDRSILINEEIAHTMCLCGLRGLETISFTFTPVSPDAIKELLGACPRLERIEVHIGISDYFTDVEGEVSQRKYRRIVKKLTALQEENKEFARVLWIKSDYG